ncbi:hypothetical protein HK102_009930, partial [Quaeritorhiza haematococci]
MKSKESEAATAGLTATGIAGEAQQPTALPIPSILSAETVTKTLRASSSAMDIHSKLSYAQNVWRDTSLYLPARHELILDWLCSTVLRSIPKHLSSTVSGAGGASTATAAVLGENAVSLQDPFLNLRFWSFLLEILNTLRAGKRRSMGAGVTVALKTPVAPIFLGFLQGVRQIVHLPQQQKSTTSAESGTTHTPVTNLAQTIQAASSCFRILTSDLPELLRATIDHHASISLEAMETLIVILSGPLSDRSDEIDEGEMRSHELVVCVMGFVRQAVSVFVRTCSQQSNQKK